jgi:hypothetical protein
MSMIFTERPSESPLVEAVMHAHTLGEGRTIRPAERHWHLVISQHDGATQALLVGPWASAGNVWWGADAEILWIKFRLGVFMPHLPTRDLLDQEITLPGAVRRSFWLNSTSWQFPDFENADTFVDRLAREETLIHDPVVGDVLKGHVPAIAPRTVRHRFLRATGLTRGQIVQIERAQEAAALLRSGISILDTVDQCGYFDQPHLTRSLKQWVGYTPAQIIRDHEIESRLVHDAILA